MFAKIEVLRKKLFFNVSHRKETRKVQSSSFLINPSLDKQEKDESPRLSGSGHCEPGAVVRQENVPL